MSNARTLIEQVTRGQEPRAVVEYFEEGLERQLFHINSAKKSMTVVTTMDDALALAKKIDSEYHPIHGVTIENDKGHVLATVEGGRVEIKPAYHGHYHFKKGDLVVVDQDYAKKHLHGRQLDMLLRHERLSSKKGLLRVIAVDPSTHDAEVVGFGPHCVEIEDHPEWYSVEVPPEALLPASSHD